MLATHRISSATASACSPSCYHVCTTPRRLAWLRCGGRHHRTGPSAAEERDHRTSDVVAWTPWPMSSRLMADTPAPGPHRYFGAPAWLQALIDQGALGSRSGAGFFRKVARTSPTSPGRDYRWADQKASDEVAAILAIKNPAEKFAKKLRASTDARRSSSGPCFATRSTTLPTTCRRHRRYGGDVDFAIRWGYGWKLGPSETWQAAGWQQVAGLGSPRTSPPARP